VAGFLRRYRHQPGKHWARQTGAAKYRHGRTQNRVSNNDFHTGKRVREPTNIGHHAVPRRNEAVLERGLWKRKAFAAACAEAGVYLAPYHNWFVSAAHTEEDVARTLGATERAFGVVAAEG
jgi:glutamate-1-semialdehyde aminotransferase